MKLTGRSNHRTAPHSQPRKGNGRSPKNGPGWMRARWVRDPGGGTPLVKHGDEMTPRLIE
jgi:hypothetical protein